MIGAKTDYWERKKPQRICSHVLGVRCSSLDFKSLPLSYSDSSEVGCTLDPAHNEFGYYEHPPTMNIFFYIKLIDNDVK